MADTTDRPELTQEEREIRALALVRQIADFTEPGADPDDDADTLQSLVRMARDILA